MFLSLFREVSSRNVAKTCSALHRCQCEFWEPDVADDGRSNVNDVLTVRCAPCALPLGIFTIGHLTDTLGKKRELAFPD